MATEFTFVCPLPNGMHARPASLLAAEARRFSSSVSIGRAGPIGAKRDLVDLRSVLSVVGLDLREGDACVVVAEGPDAEAAIGALRAFVDTRLVGLDDTQSAEPQMGCPSRLPASLRRLDVAHAFGRGVCPGIGIGTVVVAKGIALCEEALRAVAADPKRELDAARRAVGIVGEDLRRRSDQAHAGTERDLLAAHSEIVDDPVLWDEIEGSIRAGKTAPQAVAAAADHFAARLRAARNAYIRDRVLDVQDICAQLLARIPGGTSDTAEIALDRPSIVFAESLTPTQLMRLAREHLRGLVLGAVGETAHTVILARSFGVPCVIHAVPAISTARPGDDAVIDADGGFVVTRITPAVARYYERERAARRRRIERLTPVIREASTTHDGVRLEIGVNASSAREVTSGVAQGAEGVGLYRTEFLFLERNAPPSEDEQFEAYTEAVSAAGGRPVIFRTFDIGGDKAAHYLHIPAEENPFLGLRGVRLHQRHPDLHLAQLRAIIRAAHKSARGLVRIMAPMVATPGEAKWFRAQVRHAERDLRERGIAIAAEIPVGVMIEVPGAAMDIDRIAEHVEFFSLGTNDLCQYWMAADRGNRAVAPLTSPLHPSFLRMLRTTVDRTRAKGKWIGVCGEMASEVANLPIMIGLGVDEISAASASVLDLKSRVHAADASRCRALLDAACACAEPPEVATLLRGASWRATEPAESPLIDRACISMACDAATKEEAIKDAIDLLFVSGRTDRPRDVEEAVWAREETYSTGLGFGIGVPHCKSDAVSTPTLGVLKLESAIEWGSMDAQPVRLVLLLAVPAAEDAGGGTAGHMQVFAKLARKLMHEEFREQLFAVADATTMEATLRAELGIA